MSFRYLHRYPFLRLLLPLIAGFLVGNYLFFKEVYIPDTVLVGVSAGLFFLLLAVYFHVAIRFGGYSAVLPIYLFLGPEPAA